MKHPVDIILRICLFLLLIADGSRLSAQPVNDNPCGAQSLTVTVWNDYELCYGGSLYAWALATATPVPAAPSCKGAAVNDVWYKFKIPATGGVYVNTSQGSSLMDIGVAAYRSTDCNGPFAEVACSDPAGNIYPSLTIDTLRPGDSVFLRVWRNSAVSGDFTLCVSAAPPAMDPNKKIGINIPAPNRNFDLNGTMTVRGYANFHQTVEAQGLYSYGILYSGGTSVLGNYLRILNSPDYFIQGGFYSNCCNSMGSNSFSFGDYSDAPGDHAFSFGNQTHASGAYSLALGYQASTNNKSRSVCIGASNTNGLNPAVANEHDNEFMVFADWYRFWTSGSGTSVYLAPGGNAWLSTCDKTKKENFEPLNGEDVLQKIAAMPITSWNYKQQSPAQFRHYGVMAQDFFEAFGKDKYGTIGCDTLVNPIDLIGVAYGGIQALEQRTRNNEEQRKQLEQLQLTNQQLEAELRQLRKEMAELKQLISSKQN